MKTRALLRLAAVSIGLASMLAPALASTTPGDLVEPEFRPSGGQDDATSLATPVFQLFRRMFERFEFSSTILVPRLRVNIDITRRTRRDRLISRQDRARTATLRRLDGRLRDAIPLRRR